METFLLLSFSKGVTVFGKMTTLESFSHSANILGSDSAQVVSAPLKSWEAQNRKVLRQNLFFHPAIEDQVLFIPIPDKQCWMWTKRQKHKLSIDGGNMCLKFADRKISFPLNHPHPPSPSPTAPTNPKWLTRQDKGQEIYSNGMPENPFEDLKFQQGKHYFSIWNLVLLVG